VCFIGSAHADRTRYHLLNGMYRALTVLPSSGPWAAAPAVDVIATIGQGDVVTFSKPLQAGRVVMRVVNETDKDLEFKFQRPPDGVSGKEFLTTPQVLTSATAGGGLSSVPARTSVITTLDFKAGDYVVGTKPAIRHPTSQVVTVAAAAAPKKARKH
jgi:hypothetical protein